MLYIYTTDEEPCFFKEQEKRKEVFRHSFSHATTKFFFILYTMYFFAELTLFGVMAHLFTYGTENGVSREVVSWAYAVIGVASLIGKVGMGSLSDRIGRKHAFLLSFMLQGAAFILLLPTPNILLIYLFALTFGLSYGGWTPLFPAALEYHTRGTPISGFHRDEYLHQ